MIETVGDNPLRATRKLHLKTRFRPQIDQWILTDLELSVSCGFPTLICPSVVALQLSIPTFFAFIIDFLWLFTLAAFLIDERFPDYRYMDPNSWIAC